MAVARKVDAERLAALDGSPLGERGLRTRTRLLAALQELLSRQKAAWIAVADVARLAGVSPATFYRYFRDVDEATLALAEGLTAEVDGIVTVLDQPWEGPDGRANVVAFIDAFLAHWEANRPVLRMRNLAAEEGDARFREVRLKTLRGITRVVARKIEANQARGLVSTEVVPATAATVLVGMLERVGAHLTGYESHRGGRAGLIDTIAVILQTTVCGSESVLAPAGQVARR